MISENTAYSLIISGGNITINSTDDGLHTNSGDLLISGGNIVISTSDDGLTADKNVKITGGNLTVLTSYEGIEGETIEISGGVNVLLQQMMELMLRVMSQLLFKDKSVILRFLVGKHMLMHRVTELIQTVAS